MPPRTSIRTFIRALQTGSTKTTRALDQILTSPGNLAGRAWFNSFRNQGALSGSFNSDIRAELVAAGLDDADITHMSQWPDAQKEILRAAIVTAVDGNRDVRSSWELHGGSSSINEIDFSGEGPIRVTFRSPRANLGIAVASIVENYDVSVDIEPGSPDPI